MSDHKVRLYKSDDDEGIVNLLVHVFGTWPNFDIECSPLDHWRWKYLDNPLTKSGTIKDPIIAVAESEGHIVGCANTLPYRVKIGKKYLLCSHGGDLAIHPNFRGRKISTKIRALRDDIRRREGIFLNLGGGTVSPIVRARNIKDGVPNFPHQHINYVNITDVGKHLRYFPTNRDAIIKMGYHVLSTINVISNALRKKETLVTHYDIVDLNYFDTSFDDLWNHIGQHYQFIVERSREYLNWRYSDLRGGRYYIKAAYEDDEAVGFIVLRINRINRDYHVGWIVDCLVKPEKIDVLNTLLRNAMGMFTEQKVNIVQILSFKNHPYEPTLKQQGFLDGRSSSVKNYREVSRMGEDLNVFLNTRVEQVHSVHGDFDYI